MDRPEKVEKAEGKRDTKPAITLKSAGGYFLSIWLDGSSARFRVSAMENGEFKHVATFSMPVDYLLYKFLERRRDSVVRLCDLLEALSGEEGGEGEGE